MIEEEPERRLRVEIKPLTNGTAPLSASVDELRTTMENITLSPVGVNVRRFNSISHWIKFLEKL